jgi:ubiquinol-cytochrome c reductase cytochrome c1 subunit
MKKLIIERVQGLLPALGMASGQVHLESANIDLHDQASLQRGAKTFVD